MSVLDIDDYSWRKTLVMKSTKDGDRIAPETGNAFLMLSNGQWKKRLAYDEFVDRYYWEKDGLALDSFDVPKAGDDLTENHLVYMSHYFARIGLPTAQGAQTCSFRIQVIADAAHAAAKRNTRNSLKDYLSALVWDGEDRLTRWCSECLGCAQTAYSGAVGTWWMISAVARAFSPGCKADHVLLLEGGQGVSKSTVLDVLGGDWFLPQLPDLRNPKDAYQVMRGKWIGEIPEMDAFKRSDVTAIKAFCTVKVDIFRRAYGHMVERQPRTIVFAATTNDEYSLSDPTGARRFWPIRCGAVIDLDKLRAWRDQLWAEAVARYQIGEQWWPTESLKPQVTGEQDQRYSGDSWETMVLEWGATRRDAFGIRDVLAGCLGLDPRDWNRSAETRVGAILHRAGFESERRSVGTYGRVRMYLPRAPAAQSNEHDD